MTAENKDSLGLSLEDSFYLTVLKTNQTSLFYLDGTYLFYSDFSSLRLSLLKIA